MVEDPDPDRDKGVIERVDSRHYGDPIDQSENYGNHMGIAPPCEECGRRETTQTVDGQDLCADCAGNENSPEKKEETRGE